MRTNISANDRVMALTEAGYRCAVPTCRGILALDLHHLVPVKDDGGNEPSNLIALCPTCHALYERGTIKKESLALWKAILVTLGNAFDKESIDNLLFLHSLRGRESPIISGDTVFRFSKLISARLVTFTRRDRRMNGFRGLKTAASGVEMVPLGYTLTLTNKGKLIVDAWKRGDREALRSALDVTPG